MKFTQILSSDVRGRPRSTSAEAVTARRVPTSGARERLPTERAQQDAAAAAREWTAGAMIVVSGPVGAGGAQMTLGILDALGRQAVYLRPQDSAQDVEALISLADVGLVLDPVGAFTPGASADAVMRAREAGVPVVCCDLEASVAGGHAVDGDVEVRVRLPDRREVQAMLERRCHALTVAPERLRGAAGAMAQASCGWDEAHRIAALALLSVLASGADLPHGRVDELIAADRSRLR